MNIFISWSKERSQKYAEAFRSWIPNVIQSAKPFISSQDISLGQKGVEQISQRLNDFSFGVLFVTKENRSEPWLLYEAGALSKSIDSSESRVIPILVDVDRGDLAGSPLSHFQNAQNLSRETILDVCNSINDLLDAPLPDDVEAQTRQVMANLALILGELGLDLSHIVQCRCFLTEFERDYAVFNETYKSHFPADRLPARTTVGVTALAVGALVEIDCIAKRPE